MNHNNQNGQWDYNAYGGQQNQGAPHSQESQQTGYAFQPELPNNFAAGSAPRQFVPRSPPQTAPTPNYQETQPHARPAYAHTQQGFQQQQHSAPPPQHQQQQQQPNPLIPGQVFDDQFTRMGMEYGRSYVANKAASWFHMFSVEPFKYYFHVSNSYVLTKLRVLLFPFIFKGWKRRFDPSSGQHIIPRYDDAAPDLYIPLMAFITYTLLYGLCLGVYHQFTPEVLTLTASSSLVMLFIEVVFFMKFGLYLITGTMHNGEPDVVAPPLLDLLSYASYKYVGAVVDLLFGVFVGPWAMSIATFYTGLCMGFFVMRTMVAATSPKTDGPTPQNKKRHILVLILGALQLVVALFLARLPAVPEAPPSPVAEVLSNE